MNATFSYNKQIAKNTAMLYIRMIITLLVTLYTSRVILKILGVEDFGIYNAVGGVVTILAFINNSMSIAVQRYLSYDLGREDIQSLNRTFGMALIIHGLIAIIVALLAETIGYYFLTHYMKFPAARLEAAKWVFHFSVLTCCIRFLQIPYNALIISFERMGLFAYLSIGEAFLGLLIVFLLQFGTFDRLQLYAVLVFGVTVIITGMYAAYCQLKIKEIKLRFVWDKTLFKHLLGFASWSALGEMAWAATGQGVNITLNLFFGPVVNAARGIAYQVLGAVNRFVQSFQMAVNPQIIKQYAAGNLSDMYSLVFRSSRFSFYLLLLLTQPLLLRMDYILFLWLGQNPPHLTIFCRLVLIGALTDVISSLLATIAKAYGNIRNYQFIVAAILILNLPLSYTSLKYGAPAESVFFVYIFISINLLFIRLYLTRRMVKLSIRAFGKNVLCPSIKVLIAAFPIPLATHILFANNLIGLIGVILISSLCVLLAIYIVGLTTTERQVVNSKLSLYYQKYTKHGK